MYIVKYLYSYIYIYTGSKICPGAKLNSPASKRRRSERKKDRDEMTLSEAIHSIFN